MKIKMIVEYLAVFSLLLSSGANPIIRDISFFIFSTTILFMVHRKIQVKYFIIFIIILCYIWINSCVLNIAPTNYKECILLTLRMCGCLIIASNITLDNYWNIFLKIMVVLAIMSLLFYTIFLVVGTLPWLTTLDGWLGTFYQTIGYSDSIATLERMRNCGIFTEPGVYQMYLNIALISLIRKENKDLVKKRRYFWLFAITLFTTRSSMGYIIFALVFTILLLERKELLPKFIVVKKKYITPLIILLGLVIFVLEFRSGFIRSFIKNVNSFSSRHDDILISFSIAIDYPIWGIGLATYPIGIWNDYYAKLEYLRLYKSYQQAMSCGIGNYAAWGGIPFAIIYFTNIYKVFVKYLKLRNKISGFILFLVVLLIVLEEPLLSTPFFLIVFFYILADIKYKRPRFLV